MGVYASEKSDVTRKPGQAPVIKNHSIDRDLARAFSTSYSAIITSDSHGSEEWHTSIVVTILPQSDSRERSVSVKLSYRGQLAQ